MKEYFLMFKRTFDFKGKSTRREFWMAVLVNSIAGILVGGLALPFLALPDVFWYAASCLGSLYEIVVFLPMLSLTIRRLHDVGKSGWYLLFGPIIFFGWILLLIWLSQPSNFKVNPWYKDYNNNPDEIVLNDDGSASPANEQNSTTMQNPSTTQTTTQTQNSSAAQMQSSTKVLGEDAAANQNAKKPSPKNDSLEKIIDELNQMYADKKISKKEYEEIMQTITGKKK